MIHDAIHGYSWFMKQLVARPKGRWASPNGGAPVNPVQPLWASGSESLSMAVDATLGVPGAIASAIEDHHPRGKTRLDAGTLTS